MLYRTLLRPLLFRLPPETAHEFAIHALSLSLGAGAMRRAARARFERPLFGELRRFGLSFKNPIGMAAGPPKKALLRRGPPCTPTRCCIASTHALTPLPGATRTPPFARAETVP